MTTTREAVTDLARHLATTASSYTAPKTIADHLYRILHDTEDPTPATVTNIAVGGTPDEQLRLSALDQAVRVAEDEQPSVTVARAEAFHAFLTAAKETDR